MLAILSQHNADAAPQFGGFGRVFRRGLHGFRRGFGGFRRGFGDFGRGPLGFFG